MCQCNDACKPHGRPYISVLINHHQSKLQIRIVNCINRNTWTSDWHIYSLPKLFIACKKGLKIPKRTLKAVNRGMGNTVAKWKKEKTNNDLQNTTQKTKIEQHEPHWKRRWSGLVSQAPLVASVVLLQLQTGDKHLMEERNERKTEDWVTGTKQKSIGHLWHIYSKSFLSSRIML